MWQETVRVLDKWFTDIDAANLENPEHEIDLVKDLTEVGSFIQVYKFFVS